MLTYELVTNAAKYGPLGPRGGQLTITVRALTSDEDARNIAENAVAIDRTDARELHLVWHERVADGAFAEEAAQEDERGAVGGFGSVLLQHSAGTLGAELKRELRSEGLRVELRWPVKPL
jgi:two-component sensor histidine kinase